MTATTQPSLPTAIRSLRTRWVLGAAALLGLGFLAAQAQAALQYHVDASALTALSDTNPINVWPDLAGGNDATASGTARPTYRTGQLGGKPVARFDGNDVMHSGDILDGVLNGVDNQFTIFVVGRDWAELSNDQILSVYNPRGKDAREMAVRIDQGNKPELFTQYHPSASHMRSATGDGLSNAGNVLALTYDGAQDGNDGLDRFGIYVDGPTNSATLRLNYGDLGDIQNTNAGFAIGGNENEYSDYTFHGDLAEILIFDGVLDDYHLNLYGYRMGQKWGIATAFLAPEPSTFLVWSLLAGLGLWFARRRR